MPSRLLVPAITIGALLAPLNSTMIAVALPNIQEAFGASLAATTVLVTAYLVVMAAGQAIGGRLGDLAGRRRVFLIGLGLFALASIAAAMAPSLPLLIAGRVLQAMGGAVAFPNGAAMVREAVPREMRGRAFGAIGLAAGVAAAAGPPLGGIVVQAWGWSSIFWVNVPVSLLALLLAWLSLPSTAPPARSGQRRDLAGGILFATALTAVMLLPSALRLHGWVLALGLAPLAAILGWWFIRHERRTVDPMVAIHLFRSPVYTAACLSIAISNLVMYTTLLALPLFLAGVRDAGPQRAGLALALMSGLWAVCGPIGGRWTDRAGRRRPAITGAVAILAGIAILFLAVSGDLDWLIVPAMLAMGIGLGVSGAPVQLAAVEAAPRAEAGAASGLFSTSRYLGSVGGSTILAILISSDAAGGDPSRFTLLFGGLVAAAAAGALVNARIVDHRSPA